MEDVLFIEPQGEALSLLSSVREANRWRFECARDSRQAELWMQQRSFQAVLLDLSLDSDQGEALLERLKQRWSSSQFIALAPPGDAHRGLRALRLGAYDQVARPLDRTALEAALKRTCERSRLGRDLRSARRREERSAVVLGSSPAARDLREALAKAAQQEAPVLILGESGSGKSLAARFLSDRSPRRGGPFVALDCRGLADAGAAELFGRPDEPGALDLAAGGTLLLEHVDGLDAPLQARLLRVLRDRGFQSGDSTRFTPLEARVLATAGPSLPAGVKAGSFRKDLFWNLGPSLMVPPLRERAGDAEELLLAFLERRCARLGRTPPTLSPAARDAVRRHPFPGNVGELEALAALIVAGARAEVDLADLPLPVSLGVHGDGTGAPLKVLVRAFERRTILGALEAAQGNQSRASQRLDIHRNTLILKMRELDIPNKRTLKRVRQVKR